MVGAVQSPRHREAPLGRLRSGDWLTAPRARAYCLIFLGVSLVVGAAWALMSRGGVDPAGKPLGTDFTSFWSAANLALRGAPQLAYDIRVHHAVEVAITGRDTGYSAFFYPPVFLLACLSFAAAPYLWSLAAWLVVTGAAYARMARAWLGESFGWAPIFAFPAVLSNVGHGQNGLLSAALIGGGARLLDRRPIVAGILFGSLAYKPHLGVIIPLSLALAGRWRTFMAAGAAALGLVLVSLALFGRATWLAFLAQSQVARAALELGLVGDYKMQSAFAAARLWGASLPLAYGLQAAMAGFAVAGLVWLNWRAPRAASEGPAMIVAGLLANPFLLDYDLVILAAPLAFLVREGVSTGFRPWEKTTLAAAFVLPAVCRTVALAARLPLTPFVLAAIFVLILRRGADTAAHAGTEPASGQAASAVA